jgi:hypothetical protein
MSTTLRHGTANSDVPPAPLEVFNFRGGLMFVRGDKKREYKKHVRFEVQRGEYVKPDQFSGAVFVTWNNPLVRIYLDGRHAMTVAPNRTALVHLRKDFAEAEGLPDRYTIILPERDVHFERKRYAPFFSV